MPLTDSSSIDYLGNKNPKCPHCDHEADIDENEWWFLYDEDAPHFVECPACEKEYQISSRATWTFDTDEQDELAEE